MTNTAAGNILVFFYIANTHSTLLGKPWIASTMDTYIDIRSWAGHGIVDAMHSWTSTSYARCHERNNVVNTNISLSKNRTRDFCVEVVRPLRQWTNKSYTGHYHDFLSFKYADVVQSTCLYLWYYYSYKLRKWQNFNINRILLIQAYTLSLWNCDYVKTIVNNRQLIFLFCINVMSITAWTDCLQSNA